MLLLIMGLAFLYFYINPNNVDFLPKCVLYQTTGILCPGCGSQRATHHLLNLNFKGVLQQNILYVIGLVILLYYLIIKAINLIFNKNIENKLGQVKVIISLLIFVILFWIARNIPFYPFNLLAPH